MFSIYIDNKENIKIGQIIKSGNILVKILDISTPKYFWVNGGEKYKCSVKKVN